MLHGIIDIGSNTIRMAVYQIEGERVMMLMKKKHTLSLAAYVKDGKLTDKGIGKAADILSEYKNFLDGLAIGSIYCISAAALRNVKNGKEAADRLFDMSGIRPRIISGEEEALYDFVGATHDMAGGAGLILDIGGASTQIVSFEGKTILAKVSLPIGSLSLGRDNMEKLLPNGEECQKMEGIARKIVGDFAVSQPPAAPHICGLGGTFKGAAILYSLIYEDAPEGLMETEKISEIVRRFCGKLTEEDKILLMLSVPERVHTLLPGLIIARAVAEHYKSPLIHYSDSGVREGFLFSEILAKESR